MGSRMESKTSWFGINEVVKCGRKHFFCGTRIVNISYRRDNVVPVFAKRG